MLAALLSQAWVGYDGGTRRPKRRYLYKGVVSTDPSAFQALFDDPVAPSKGKRKRAKLAPVVANEAPAPPVVRRRVLAEPFYERAIAAAAARRAETMRVVVTAGEAIHFRVEAEDEDEDDIEALIVLGML